MGESVRMAFVSCRISNRRSPNLNGWIIPTAARGCWGHFLVPRASPLFLLWPFCTRTRAKTRQDGPFAIVSTVGTALAPWTELHVRIGMSASFWRGKEVLMLVSPSRTKERARLRRASEPMISPLRERTEGASLWNRCSRQLTSGLLCAAEVHG